MALKLNKTTLLIARWSAERGKSYVHQDEPAICLTCDVGDETFGTQAPYTFACQAADHTKKVTRHTTVEEVAPEESKKVQQLYGRIHSKLRQKGYAAGDSVYLYADDVNLSDMLNAIHAEVDAANVEFKTCSAAFFFTIVEIMPGAAHAETLKSLKQTVEVAVEKLLDALRDAATDKVSREAMRKAVRETENLAQLLDDNARRQVKSLSHFTTRMAKRLKDCAEDGEAAVAAAVHEAKQGAIRFATIFADMSDDNADVAAQTHEGAA